MALPLTASAYLGAAEAAVGIARAQVAERTDDPAIPILLGELTNELTTARPAVDSMVAIANDGDFQPIAETADAVLVRKTTAAKAIVATAGKAPEFAGFAGHPHPPNPSRRAPPSPLEGEGKKS